MVGGDTDGIAGMACPGSAGFDNSGQKNTGTGQLNVSFLLIIRWGWLTTGLSAGEEQ